MDSEKNKKNYSDVEIHSRDNELKSKKIKLEKIFLDSSPHDEPAEKGGGGTSQKGGGIHYAWNILFYLYVCAHKSTFAAKVV